MGKRKPYPPGRAPKTREANAEQEKGTIFFHMPQEKPYGVFCQWHTSPFTIPTSSPQWLVDMAPPSPPIADPITPNGTEGSNVTSAGTTLRTYGDGITFHLRRAIHMFCKAPYFSDAESCSRILATPDPKTQKKHGQAVKNFRFYDWGLVKSRVACVGSWYKYTSLENKHMRDMLLGTGERELAEAARRYRVWGIGYKADEAEPYREFWGENLLGKALMSVMGRMRELERREKEWEVVDWEWDVAVEGDKEGGGDDALDEAGEFEVSGGVTPK